MAHGCLVPKYTVVAWHGPVGEPQLPTPFRAEVSEVVYPADS